ncbi:MAG: UvrD-helicase domain-containing protein [Firmicutes bacterium]|jgi:ATP-dependent helicase/nuclease subunit A|nr:UvrD-helicase domain-containing protein [Bacillota bacterium]MDH7495923.1 UvrD-helicase domain-containing protein [Bacillota bacterium]
MTAAAEAVESLVEKSTVWTAEQWEAIIARGRNLLVSAAAGSGKTSVLVQRIVELVTDGERPVDIDRLLVVTFTESAASEMRERITAALDDLLVRDSGCDAARLARQLALVKKADISTVHSFCHKVVRQHFYRLDIDPTFRVMDEVEAALMRLEVADELFEEGYANKASGRFIDLVDAYGGARGDEALRDLVIRVYDRSRGQPRPDWWFDRITKAFVIEPGACVDALPWTAVVLKSVLRDLERARRLLSRALELAGSPGGPSAYGAALQGDLCACSRILEAARQGGFEGLYEAFTGFAFEKTPRVRAGSCDGALKARVKALRDEAKKLIVAARDTYFSRPPEDLVADLRRTAPLMEELVRIVREFSRRYAEAKRARGLADFSDLEHLCLQALGAWDEAKGRFEPSDIARELAERYEEVLVDEYQDINPVQDAIISLVSRGDNTFMVGDVKQSIYGFRLAEPCLFAEKYRAYSSSTSDCGRRIDLSKNFRSRKAIVDAVNFVFRQVFSEDLAGISYDRSAELSYGADFPDDGGAVDAPVELHIIDTKGGFAHGTDAAEDSNSEETGVRRSPQAPLPVESAAGGEGVAPEENAGEDTDTGEADEPETPWNERGSERRGEGEPTLEEAENLELEGRLIANRISRMVRGAPDAPGPEFRVWDRRAKAYRPVSYRDIVVLMRVTRHRANLLLEVFRQAGVPAYAELGTGYFEATEVEVMLSLLRVIDNPMQDIPLAAVLRSPIGGFTADDLARIRMCRRDEDFYSALKAASEHGTVQPAEDGASPAVCPEDLVERIRRFLGDLERWRTLARRVPLSTLIWTLYRETRYLDFVGGMPGGAQRQANLRALHERARQFDKFSRQGLFRFLRFVERLRDAEGDLGTARALGEAEDVVRIMSVHKSKGLEFPVVFVADLGKELNLRDTVGDVLLHADAGLGPVFYDADRRMKYPTLAHHATRERVRLDALAEEMRILYVAMTRAKERLILVGSAQDLTKQASRWCEGVQEVGWLLSDDAVLSARGFLDWIASAVARHGDGAPIRDLAEVSVEPHGDVRDDPARFSVRIWHRSDLSCAVGIPRELGAVRGADILREVAAARPLGRTIMPEFRRVVQEHLCWEYPYARLAERAAKATWAEVKRRFEAGRDDAGHSLESAGGARPTAAAVPAALLEQPRFMQAFRVTPTERGQAMHLVLQHVDLGGALDAQAIGARVNEMVECDLLTTDLAATIDTKAIERFFASPLGRRVVDARDRVQREIPFYLGIDAKEVYPETAPVGDAAERVVVQGIIDCLIDEGDGFVLIDFKTGSQGWKDPDEAARAYAGQIRVYAAAVEAVHRRPVKEAYIYFLDAGSAVRVEPHMGKANPEEQRRA